VQFKTLPPTTDPHFEALISAYLCVNIEFPQLKAITAAQWALESGWGGSMLAQKHLNFAGMKWRPFMADVATPVHYVANDGPADYCNFNTYDAFIKGYWLRLDKNSAYAGWRNHTISGFDFIAKIGPTWVGTNPAHQHLYVSEIISLANQHTYPIFGAADDSSKHPGQAA